MVNVKNKRCVPTTVAPRSRHLGGGHQTQRDSAQQEKNGMVDVRDHGYDGCTSKSTYGKSSAKVAGLCSCHVRDWIVCILRTCTTRTYSVLYCCFHRCQTNLEELTDVRFRTNLIYEGISKEDARKKVLQHPPRRSERSMGTWPSRRNGKRRTPRQRRHDGYIRSM